MPPKDTLGNRVRVVRERLGITQLDLAREVGISRQALISVEKGRMNPSVVVSLKMARILREPVDYLFFLDGRAGEASEPKRPAAVKAATPEPIAAPAAVAAPIIEEAPPAVIVPEPETPAAEEALPEVILPPAAEYAPVRHAVPVSAEPEAVRPSPEDDVEDTDEAQLSLFD